VYTLHKGDTENNDDNNNNNNNNSRTTKIFVSFVIFFFFLFLPVLHPNVLLSNFLLMSGVFTDVPELMWVAVA
jgi:hypothetical protein